MGVTLLGVEIVNHSKNHIQHSEMHANLTVLQGTVETMAFKRHKI